MLHFKHYVFLEAPRTVLNKLAEFPIDCCLRLNLLSNHVSDGRLESVKLGGFGLKHPIVLLLLRLDLLADSIEQSLNIVELCSGLPLLGLEAISQIGNHCVNCCGLVSFSCLYICLQRMESMLQPFNSLFILIRAGVLRHSSTIFQL